jgi:hypothetical protein
MAMAVAVAMAVAEVPFRVVSVHSSVGAAREAAFAVHWSVYLLVMLMPMLVLLTLVVVIAPVALAAAVVVKSTALSCLSARLGSARPVS